MRPFHPFTLSAIVVLSAATLQAQAVPTYHVARTVKIGGDGGFDYVTADPAAKRVFLTHASHVVVYDLAKDAVVGDISNTTGVHGVALAPDLNRGFTSNGRDSSVTIFDYTTLAVITVLPIHAINPDAITYDELTKRIFTWNHGTHDATVIDAAKGEVVGRIPNMGTPETAVTDGKGSLWVNVEDSAMVIHIDTRTMKELHRFSIAPCDEPTGMAIDRTTYAPVQTATTQRGARTMALDPLTHTVYQMAVEYGPAPAPAAPGGRPPRPPMIPGSFSLLVVTP